MLDAGVRIWAYQPSMLHAKIMTVDRIVANVRSANFNSRSLELDDELNLVVLDRDLVRDLDADFDEDVSRSTAIDPERWEDRSIVQRVKRRPPTLSNGTSEETNMIRARP